MALGTVDGVRSLRDRDLVAWTRDHPFVPDTVLAAFLLVVTAVGLWYAPDHMNDKIHWRHADALGVLIVVLEIAPLAWRRRKPELVLLLVGTATVAFYAAGYAPTTGGTPALIAFYTMAAYRQRERLLWPVGFVFSGLAASLLFDRGPVGLGTIIANAAMFSAAWFVGDNVRNRRARTVALVERAERLEREREANARQAVAEERARIGRELHDVVAHSMSVMVVQAGAARRVMDRSPEEARDALLSIEDTGRQALEEMRRLLGVFRGDDRGNDRAESGPERAPQPTVRDLDGLVDVVREAGLDASVVVEGEPHVLPSGVELSAYRVVQEALTNSLKHAGPARARVVVRWTEHQLELEVTDDGRGLAARAAGDGQASGHGLVGMRERVSLYGGDLLVGPAAGGGFRVLARFPVAARPSPAGRS